MGNTIIVNGGIMGPPGPRGYQGFQGVPGTSPSTASFATTGSNVFTGFQVISGSVRITSGSSFIGNVTGTASFSATASYFSGSISTSVSSSYSSNSTYSISSSYAATASYTNNAATASFIAGGLPAPSFVFNAVSGSISSFDLNYYIGIDPTSVSGTGLSSVQAYYLPSVHMYSENITATSVIIPDEVNMGSFSLSGSYPTDTSPIASGSFPSLRKFLSGNGYQNTYNTLDDGTTQASLYVALLANLKSFSAPLLSSSYSDIRFDNNPLLDAINLNSLKSTTTVEFTLLPSLKRISLPSMLSGEVNINDCSTLESLSLPLHYNGEISVYDCPLLSTASLGSTSSIAFVSGNNPALKVFSSNAKSVRISGGFEVLTFPNATEIGSHLGSNYIYSPDGGALTTFSAPKCVTGSDLRIELYSSSLLEFPSASIGDFEITYSNTLLTASFPNFVSGNINIIECSSIKSFSYPNSYIGDDYDYSNNGSWIVIQNNPSLESVNFGNIGTVKKMKRRIDLFNNNLNSGSISSILSLLVSLDGTNGTTLWGNNGDGLNGSLFLYSGSNAAPSGSDWANIDILNSRGNNIYHNSPFTIGQQVGGGTVIAIYKGGDNNNKPRTFLIASNSNLSTGIQWYNGSDINISGTANISGSINTPLIIAAQGAVTSSYAAGLAAGYNGGGYNDWYLPSVDELKFAMDASSGFFTENVRYWSSTQASVNMALYATKPSGGGNAQDGNAVKSDLYYVRAFRMISF